MTEHHEQAAVMVYIVAKRIPARCNCDGDGHEVMAVFANRDNAVAFVRQNKLPYETVDDFFFFPFAVQDL